MYSNTIKNLKYYKTFYTVSSQNINLLNFKNTLSIQLKSIRGKIKTIKNTFVKYDK